MEANEDDNFYFETCKDPRIIPRELLLQNKERDYTEDFFYQNAMINRDNPLFVLQVLKKVDDPVGRVYGYIWMDFDPSCNALFVHSFSVKKDLWGKGKTLKVLQKHLQSCKEKIGCKVRWLSSRPRLFEKMGFKKTKTVMFEVE